MGIDHLHHVGAGVVEPNQRQPKCTAHKPPPAPTTAATTISANHCIGRRGRRSSSAVIPGIGSSGLAVGTVAMLGLPVDIFQFFGDSAADMVRHIHRRSKIGLYGPAPAGTWCNRNRPCKARPRTRQPHGRLPRGWRFNLARWGCARCDSYFGRALPHASEQLALCALLATQVAASALLFPLLLQNLSSTVFAITTAWPLAQLAAFLADAPLHQWLAAEFYVSSWLIALHLWSRVLQNSWAKVFGVTIAAMLSLGGPLLWYLRLEFSDGSGRGFAMFGPIAGAISLSMTGASHATVWGFVLILILGALGLMWKRS